MRITVIGGSGATGSAVVAEAARRGHTAHQRARSTRAGTVGRPPGATPDSRPAEPPRRRMVMRQPDPRISD